ncbi:type IV pilus assembly protein PilM [Patescibacteria group bacterium]
MFDSLNLKPEAFGLDISDLSLKIAKLKKKGKFLSLDAFGETEIAPGIISEGEIKDVKSLSKIIKEATRNTQGKLKTKYVNCSLPEEKSFLQVIRLPKMKEVDMKKAAYFEAENYVPVSVDQLYLDSQKITPTKNNLDHSDVLIAALPKKIVNPYLSCLKEAGLKPLAFEIESQAITRALIKNEFSPSPILLIDLGATRTSFIVFSGYSVRFTGSISTSSQKFTEAIAQNLKINTTKAEYLKLKYGLREKIKNKKKSKKEKSEVFEALVPMLTDFVEQINKYLNYYQTHSFHEHLPESNKKLAKIFLSGGGSNLKGLIEFLSLELKIPVELASPWVNILPKPLKEVPALPFEESLGYTTALGLALRDIKNND